VVEALDEDWERPPFTLTQDDVNFYARGTVDNKFGVAQLTSTFVRLKKVRFRTQSRSYPGVFRR
jgi:carboxypeptidase PM20D1